MRIFLTGGTGFIGQHVAQLLRSRGDDVAALVRSPGKAGVLSAIGCELVEGDLDDVGKMTEAMQGADAVIHSAGLYEVGVSADRHAALHQVNVVGTANVLNAAHAAGVRRIVYVSTFGALGDSRGAVKDETAVHHGEYVSEYDRTKHLAHQIAEQRIADGLPVVIVMPTQVYGPGDHSQIAAVIDLFFKRRMPAVAFPDLGLSLAYRDDVAAGIVAALDEGRIGEGYILSGDNTTMRGFVDALAEAAGRRPPRVNLPTGVLRALAPFGRWIGPPMGLAPNFRELIATGDGVTFWGSHDKATAELGYDPRPLAQGLRETLMLQGRL